MNGAVTGGETSQTLYEIRTQPEVWRSVATAVPDLRAMESVLAPKPDIVICTGCGSSYYLALAAATMFQRVAGWEALAVPSSEVVLFPELALRPGRRTLMVVISRSGETTEAVAAARVAREHGAMVLGVSCNPTATLASMCNANLLVPEAREDSVVMTRSFTTMLLGIQRCVGLVAGNSGFLTALASLPERASGLDPASTETLQELGGDLTWDSVVFLGAGPLYGIAAEACMKMTETSLTTTNVYRPLEFRHGPMSLVDERTLVVLLTSEAARAHELAVVRDARGYGARALVLATNADRLGDLDAEYRIAVDAKIDDYARAILYLPPLQSLGVFRALAKGVNPDAPRHLTPFVSLDWHTEAASVTA